MTETHPSTPSRDGQDRTPAGRRKRRRRAPTPEQRARKAERGRAYRAANREHIAEQKRQWRKAHPERVAATQRKWRRAHPDYLTAKRRRWCERNVARTLLKTARCQAKRSKLPFALTVNDIVVPARCPLVGLLLQIGKGQAGPNSPTLARVDRDKGWVRGNVRVISLAARWLQFAANYSSDPAARKTAMRLDRSFGGQQ